MGTYDTELGFARRATECVESRCWVGDKFCGGVVLDDPSCIEDEDLVKVNDGPQSV